MTFGAAIKHGFSNLTNFKGRATRSEFWWFYLFLTLVTIPVSILIATVGMAALIPAMANVDPVTGEIPSEDLGAFLAGLGIIYGLSFLLGIAVFFLLLAAWVRRLHDAGYSGHWLWLSLVGLSLIPLIFAIFDTQRGANQWGEDPKAAERGAWPGTPVPYGAPAAPIANPYAQQPPPLAPPTAAPLAPPPAAPLDPGAPTDPFAAPPR